jgi:hypothetical protein
MVYFQSDEWNYAELRPNVSLEQESGTVACQKRTAPLDVVQMDFVAWTQRLGVPAGEK